MNTFILRNPFSVLVVDTAPKVKGVSSVGRTLRALSLRSKRGRHNNNNKKRIASHGRLTICTQEIIYTRICRHIIRYVEVKVEFEAINVEQMFVL